MSAQPPAPSTMLPGKNVYRVVWKLNTDVLLGYCYCGATHESEDPIELWDWLLAHPGTHPPKAGSGGDSGFPVPGRELADTR